MKYIRKMKYILKKKSKVEDFRWILYFHCYEDKNITYYGLALKYKNRPELPVYGNHKHYIMSAEKVQEAANMYLKSQGFIRDKYTWLDRSE